MTAVRCAGPHRWDRPALGDHSLVCLACFRYVAYAELRAEPWRRAAIVNSLRARFGWRLADDFNRALEHAMRHAERRAA